jgi:hypothetical protein
VKKNGTSLDSKGLKIARNRNSFRDLKCTKCSLYCRDCTAVSAAVSSLLADFLRLSARSKALQRAVRLEPNSGVSIAGQFASLQVTMACLNSQGSGFTSMDLEANNGNKPLVGQNRKRKCLNLPVILGALGLLFGTVALIIAGISASRTGRTSSSGSSTPSLENAVVFVRDPRHVPEGFVLGPSLSQGTGYYARLQPMVYSRSDHKVSHGTASSQRRPYTLNVNTIQLHAI